mmetsp:Transcript_4100/g.15157  ORF Transcript_4100/g.15157 Transcript_4100/m.15157 type:complete len:97 (-) Transcript_4100:388-678(-)
MACIVASSTGSRRVPQHSLGSRSKLVLEWIRYVVRFNPDMSMMQVYTLRKTCLQIMQFQDTEAVPEGNLGKARVDISEMEIGEVEELLQRRGIAKV